MNISQQTINNLKELYTVSFFDQNVNDVPPAVAVELHIGYDKSAGQYLFKTIKAKKGEMTLEWILDKINSESIYKSFATDFNKIVKIEGISAYATTYGIGVFVAFGFRKSIEETKLKIDSALQALGIDYTNEYSEAGWIFRYKISKAKENIKKIQEINSK